MPQSAQDLVAAGGGVPAPSSGRAASSALACPGTSISGTTVIIRWAA